MLRLDYIPSPPASECFYPSRQPGNFPGRHIPVQNTQLGAAHYDWLCLLESLLRTLRILSVNRQLNLFDECAHPAQPVAINCTATFCLADTFFRRCMVSHIRGSIWIRYLWTPGYTYRLVKRQPIDEQCFSFFLANANVTFACGRRNKCSGQTERDVRCPRF